MSVLICIQLVRFYGGGGVTGCGFLSYRHSLMLWPRLASNLRQSCLMASQELGLQAPATRPKPRPVKPSAPMLTQDLAHIGHTLHH